MGMLINHKAKPSALLTLRLHQILYFTYSMSKAMLQLFKELLIKSINTCTVAIHTGPYPNFNMPFIREWDTR